MNLFSAPKAPNPFTTAQAQTNSNNATAAYQQALNSVNQVTPYGNLTYSQNGTWSNGAPRLTATQTLSPTGQQVLDQQNQFDLKSNQIANTQLGRVENVLNDPINLSNDAVESRLYELGKARLEPRFAEQQQQLEQSLMNRGIRPGSAAYETLTRQFNEGKNDAYNQLLLQGRNTAVGEILQQRNQPINETIALMNGQQLATPNYLNTPTTQVQGTNIAGLIQDNYATKNSNYQAALGGLFGLGGSLAQAGGYAYGRRQ